MKLKYILPLFIATVALMTGCAEEDPVTLLDEIKVSSSFVSLPMDGGFATITVTAQDSWKVREKEIEEPVEGGEEGETEIKIVTDKPEWLTLSAVSGNAGENELKFSAESTLDGRVGEIVIECGNVTQRINIAQGLPIATEYTVAQVKDLPDGKLARVKGVCTRIDNTLYGNWYITDETGSMLIYGTLDKTGKERNFLSLGLEVGDEVIIEGPKSDYKGDAQLVNVTVVQINKSYIKVDSLENKVLPKEGGEFIAHLALNKLSQGVSVDIPEDAKDWLSVTTIQTTETSAVVKLQAKANSGGDRSTTISFRTTDGKKEYSTEATLTQEGAIVDATVAEFLAAEVDGTQYRLAGVITKIDERYNNNLYISDFSGEVYVYKLDLQGKEYKVGDIVTVVGKRGEYKDDPQVAEGGVLESVIPVTPASIADVLTKTDSKDDYFMVTGVITEIVHMDNGNLYLEDGGSKIYMYRCTPGYGAKGDDRNGLLAAKGIKVDDKLTVIATKGSYNDAAQLANGFYFSHESAE